MPETPVKFQVFVSSTYIDLVEERREAIESILKMEHFPIGMELFSADNDEQWEVIKKTIDTSDIYILIIGHRYGSLTKKDKIAYTKKEFDYARRKKNKDEIEMLCFIRDRNVPIPQDKLDSDPESKKRLEAFIQEVKESGLTVKQWESSSDLSKEITIALSKCIDRINSRTHRVSGWVKRSSIIAQQEDLARLAGIKKVMHNTAMDFETINDDVETYKVDKHGNCVIIRNRTQVCNCDLTHAYTKYVADKPGVSRILTITDLKTGNPLNYLINESTGAQFSFFTLFDGLLKKGDSIQYRCEVKVQNYLSDLVDTGIGTIAYIPFRKTSFSNKKDIIIFPNIPLFANVQAKLVHTINGNPINQTVGREKTSKTIKFVLDYGELKAGSNVKIEFRIPNFEKHRKKKHL